VGEGGRFSGRVRVHLFLPIHPVLLLPFLLHNFVSTSQPESDFIILRPPVRYSLFSAPPKIPKKSFDTPRLSNYNERRSLIEQLITSEADMGTTQRRQREAAARRKAILTAGLKLFRKQGYARTTMPQIAAAAELAPGTLYLYFPSKEALYVELLAEGYAQLQARLARPAASAAPLRRRAEAMIDAFLGFACERPEYFEIIFFLLQRERTGDWEDTFDRDQLARVRAQEAACKTAAAEVLGQFAPGSAARRRHTVDAVWSMLCGVVEHFGGQKDFDAVARQAKAVIIAGIFCRV